MNLLITKEFIADRGIITCVNYAVKQAKKRYKERIQLIKKNKQDMEISIEIRPRMKSDTSGLSF